jgi:hypothetical protein
MKREAISSPYSMDIHFSLRSVSESFRAHYSDLVKKIAKNPKKEKKSICTK